jgi:hypothetical protein
LFACDCAETQLTSVSGALAKRVKKWTLSLSKENLDFYALQLPKEPWFVSRARAHTRTHDTKHDTKHDIQC